MMKWIRGTLFLYEEMSDARRRPGLAFKGSDCWQVYKPGPSRSGRRGDGITSLSGEAGSRVILFSAHTSFKKWAGTTVMFDPLLGCGGAAQWVS
ncbi:MAG: hypothetical protein KCHDKBKB_01363 [Elusimicrobia bacterium]|nr:hypothetical protein [Elusimicrobiota bacterium]